MRVMRVLRIGVIILLFFLLPALFMWKLTLAGRILVGGDPLNFFYPYHDGVATALAAGRLPEWNPYLFGGGPFLADSQAQVFYPLAWLFWGVDAPTTLTWSVVLHLAIAGVGMYTWARRGLGLGESGAWVAGAVFALGGYLGAQVEHMNQVAAAAWIPWLLLGYELARGTVLDAEGNPMTVVANTPQRWRTRTWGALLGAGALGLSLLAGHAQTTFMGLVLLGLWGVRWAVRDDARTKREVLAAQRGGGFAPVVAAAWRNFVGVNIVPLVWVVLLGALLAAVQVVPTQLLSGLSTRAGGLEFREAVAFSFDPRIALRAFLPTFGQDDPLLSEYVAWIGFSGLALVGLGAWRGRGAAREFGLLSSVTGLFLALGAYNPLFWLLWRIVPGFDLFRVPARWLLLWAVGAAVLAGLGMEAGARRKEEQQNVERRTQDAGRKRLLWVVLGIVGIVGVIGLGIFGDFPNVAVIPWWGGALLVTAILGGVWRWVESRPTSRIPLSAFRVLLSAFLLIELWLGSWGLGYQGATAAEAHTGMRTTVAHLLTMTSPSNPFPMAENTDTETPLADFGLLGQGDGGRVLSRSGLTWDPGDLARLEGRYADQLSDEAIYDLVVATKLKEVLAPNQPMRWGIPSADGYGGGLLPSARWVEFQQVLPLAKVVPDGRLREQLTALPRRELLDVMGVEWLVADKVTDWWSEGIYHDLGAARPMQAAERVMWTPPAGAQFMRMDTLSFVVQGILPPDAGTVAVGDQSFALNNAVEQAVRTTPQGEERHYLLNLATSIGGAETIAIEVGSGEWVLGGLTVWNSQLRGFEALAADPSLKTTLSGDVKVYQRLDYVGRAWFAPTARFVTDAENGAEYIAEAGYDPLLVAIVEDERDAFEVFGGTGTVNWIRESAERLELSVDTPEGGWLVVADAPFPGWTVTIDGVEAEWYPANVINRVVLVPAGTHTVVWDYHTPGLVWGVAGTAAGIVMMLGVAAWAVWRR
jgi:hypothetical protein